MGHKAEVDWLKRSVEAARDDVPSRGTVIQLQRGLVGVVGVSGVTVGHANAASSVGAGAGGALTSGGSGGALGAAKPLLAIALATSAGAGTWLYVENRGETPIVRGGSARGDAEGEVVDAAPRPQQREVPGASGASEKPALPSASLGAPGVRVPRGVESASEVALSTGATPRKAAEVRGGPRPGDRVAPPVASQGPRGSLGAASAEPLPQPNALQSTNLPGDGAERGSRQTPALEGGPERRGPESESLSIRLEAQLIDQARATLASNPSGTLALLGRHEREFPQGVLLVERRVLLIEALARLGRVTEAGLALESFRRSYPSSAHLQRLESVVARRGPK